MRASKTVDELEDRFWAKVPDAPRGLECWEWGGTRSRGYGMFWVPAHLIPWVGCTYSRMHQAHRIAYWFSRGTWPDEYGDDTDVCHGCDNPACVRPSHLFIGTHRENMLDAKGKGRISRAGAPAGEASALHKLKDEDVRAIYARAHSGERQATIAADFNVTMSMVSHIKRRAKRSSALEVAR